MRNAAKKLGVIGFWLAWPAHYFYLKLSTRTRVLLVRDGKVLVVRNWISDGRWSLPGGGMHKDETPLEGARRELKEEIGLDLGNNQLKPLGEAVYRAYGHEYPFYSFIAELTDNVPIKKQWYEIADAEWIDPAELTPQNAGPDVMLTLRAWLG